MAVLWRLDIGANGGRYATLARRSNIFQTCQRQQAKGPPAAYCSFSAARHSLAGIANTGGGR